MDMTKGFHQSKVNLFFRKAYQDYQLFMAGQKLSYPGNPFEHYFKQLKRRLGENFKLKDEIYWDILFSVNMRGKSIDQLIQEESQIDPEKEQYIREMVETGSFKKKIEYFLPKQ